MFVLAKCVLLLSSCGHRDQQSVQDLSPHSLLSCWCPSLLNFSTQSNDFAHGSVQTSFYLLSGNYRNIILHGLQNATKCAGVCLYLNKRTTLFYFLYCMHSHIVCVYVWVLKFILSCVRHSVRCKFHHLRVYE